MLPGAASEEQHMRDPDDKGDGDDDGDDDA